MSTKVASTQREDRPRSRCTLPGAERLDAIPCMRAARPPARPTAPVRSPRAARPVEGGWRSAAPIRGDLRACTLPVQPDVESVDRCSSLRLALDTTSRHRGSVTAPDLRCARTVNHTAGSSGAAGVPEMTPFLGFSLRPRGSAGETVNLAGMLARGSSVQLRPSVSVNGWLLSWYDATKPPAAAPCARPVALSPNPRCRGVRRVPAAPTRPPRRAVPAEAGRTRAERPPAALDRARAPAGFATGCAAPAPASCTAAPGPAMKVGGVTRPTDRPGGVRVRLAGLSVSRRTCTTHT